MRTVNDHARASVSVQIKDAWEERYIGILSGEIWVKITGISGEVHTVLFHGLLQIMPSPMTAMEQSWSCRWQAEAS